MESFSDTDIHLWVRNVLIDEAQFVLGGRIGRNTEHAHLANMDAGMQANYHQGYNYICVQTYAAFAKAVRSDLDIAVDREGNRVAAPETESAEENLRRRQHFSTSERKSGTRPRETETKIFISFRAHLPKDSRFFFLLAC
jgi:hypothetical protein